METGTFRYAWTQGFGRWRWSLAKLVSLAVAVTVPAWLFSLVLSWYYQPYFATGNQALGLTEMTPFFPGLFDLHGVAFAAWTLAAFAIGALAGMLIRRVVPAIAVTLAVYAGLAFAAGTFLREHYLTPLVTSALNLPGSAWILEPVVDQGRRDAQPGHDVPGHQLRVAAGQPTRAGRGGRGRKVRGLPQRAAVPHQARVHAVDAVSAGQPVLAVPVDRERLAARGCRCCSSPRPSGWSAAAPPDASRQGNPGPLGLKITDHWVTPMRERPSRPRVL